MTNPEITNSEIESVPGRFELPQPDPFYEHAAGATLQGASAGATWDESDEQGSSANPHDFPMIVWLRGDEPWFTQFDMDADAVMAALGIKRSRLTQISGRDLRVGRVRVDRYIRPVYRSIDVEQYLSWTRATASHQKSSDAIKIAVDQLQEQSRMIQDGLDNITNHFTAHIKNEMSSFIASAVSSGLDPLVERSRQFESSTLELLNQMEQKVVGSITDNAEQLRLTTETIRETARQQAAALEVLTLQLNQTSEKTAAMEERLSAWDQLLRSNLKAISDDLASLKRPKPFQKLGTGKVKPAKTKAMDSILTPQAKPVPKLSLRSSPARRKPK